MDIQNQIPNELRVKARILVVEDNLLNQKLDSFILNNWGLQHEICSNGQKAIDLLKTGSLFDVILMDIQMPVLNGYEATRIIREEMNLSVPVIGITAHANDSEKHRCLAVGMNHYITKPINEEELLSLLVSSLVPSEAVK